VTSAIIRPATSTPGTYYSRRIRALNEALYPRRALLERIVTAKRFIDHCYADRVTLDQISRRAFLSKYHFIRLFRKHYGRTPHQHLTDVRVARAKELISGGMTVRAACFAVGYDSVSSFCALFRRVTGRAPLRTRRNRAIFDH
jgi:AraC-like DNA-binding protein